MREKVKKLVLVLTIMVLIFMGVGIEGVIGVYAAGEEQQEGDYKYVENGEGNVIITEYIGTDTEIEIPETLGGLDVVEIGMFSFSDKGIEEVIIPEGIKKIKAYAFSDNELTEIKLHGGVDISEGDIFRGNKIVNVEFGEGIQYIGSYAFMGNKIKSLELPESMKVISFGAFSSNEIEDLKLGNGVEEIWDTAFRNNKIEELVIPEGLSKIQGSVFENNRIKHLILPDTVKSIGLFSFKDNMMESVQFGTGINKIGAGAFINNNLVSVTIPGTVKEIKENTFTGNKLKKVVFEEGVTKIGYESFNGNHIEELSLPESIVEVGEGAFMWNKITDLKLPKGLKVIQDAAFMMNPVKNIVISKTVEEIGDLSLVMCDSLETVIVQNRTLNLEDVLIYDTCKGELGLIMFRGHKESTIKNYVEEYRVLFDEIKKQNGIEDEIGFIFKHGEGEVEFEEESKKAGKTEVKINVENADEDKDLEYLWSRTDNVTSEGVWEGFNDGDIVESPEGEYGEFYIHVRGTDILADSFYIISGKVEVEPREEGKLELNLPEVREFGEVDVRGKEGIYDIYQTLEGDIGIIDTRGTEEGWSLKVGATTLKNEQVDMGQGHVIIGDIKGIDTNGKIISRGIEEGTEIDRGELVEVARVQGEGETTIRYGEKALGFRFNPREVVTGEYTTTVTWVLESVPGI